MPKKLPSYDIEIINLIEKNNEPELRYKIAKCLLERKQIKEAVLQLQCLTSKQRTPKINFLLSNIYKNNGNEKSALSLYREVLKVCPLAFEAIEGLLSLRVKGTEVNSLVLNGELSKD